MLKALNKTAKRIIKCYEGVKSIIKVLKAYKSAKSMIKVLKEL